jgi:hypothetical protein
MHVYPERGSWDEFYPNDIFIALSTGETINDAIGALVKANIGATIVIGKNATQSQAYKKVEEIESVADLAKSLVLLSTAAIVENG